MKLKLYLWLFMGLIFIASCEKETTILEVGTDPVIEEIRIRSKWNSLSNVFNKVEVKITDPQGFSNIIPVEFSVKNQLTGQVVFTDSLFDDGAYLYPQDGDVIAGDGVFSNRFSATQILYGADDGEYIFYFTALDKEGHESQAAEQLAVFGPNVRPEIVSIAGEDTLFSGTPGQIFEVAVFDSDGVDDIIRVYFETRNSLNQPIEIFDLFNDGDFAQSGDLFADDSLYSIKLDSTFGADKLGLYTLHFHLEDSFNEENSTIPIHQIFVENKVGKVISTTIPDTIIRPISEYKELDVFAFVSDPQGLSDIDSVYFMSQASDDSFVVDINGNIVRVILFDDGSNGDLTPGDGIFSRTLRIYNNNIPDDYRFHFYMRDQLKHLSEVKIDSIAIL